MSIIRLIQLTIIALIPLTTSAQKSQVWKIADVLNTFLEIGVPKPQQEDFGPTKLFFLGKNIYIKDTLLFFSKKLKKSESYADSIFIKESKTYKRAKDTEVSFRFPGDELNCKVDDERLNNCFAGDSFMKLLGNKGSFLTFYELRSNYPNFFGYKLCVIKKGKKMGLLLENSSVLLILERQ